MDALAPWSGWLALLVITSAGFVPLSQRLRRGRRAEVGSAPMRVHVALGIAASAAAALHTLMALPALGSAAAISGGALALVPGAVAFLVVVAHVGIGLQLRSPKLRARANKRRAHQITALCIVVLAALHAVVLLRGAS
jgi:formate-dependent nitrite reductase membrane component NrfD